MCQETFKHGNMKYNSDLINSVSKDTILQYLKDIFSLKIYCFEKKVKAAIKIYKTKTKSNSSEFKTDSREIRTIDTGS